MNLTAPNLVHYLLHRRLVDLPSIVDGDFAVRDSISRHHSFRVERGTRPGLFLKQPLHGGPRDAVNTLRRESWWCQAVNSIDRLASLRRLLPTFVEFDESRSVLTVELLNGKCLLDHHQQTGSYTAAIGRALATALADIHAIPIDPLEPMLRPEQLNRKLPHPLWRPWLRPGRVPFTAAAEKHVGASLHMCGVLEELRSSLRYDSLIHGDVKLDNFSLEASIDESVQLKVLDWELVDRGDAAWDVGSIFSNYTALILLTCSESTVETHPDGGVLREALHRLRPLLTAFWNTYADQRGMSGHDRDGELHRCFQFAAARMIQTACQVRTTHPFYRLLMEAVEVFLLSPRRAVSHLLEV